MIQEWTYEVKPHGSGFVARQLLNGTLLKSWPCETREEGETQCKKWEATRR